MLFSMHKLTRSGKSLLAAVAFMASAALAPAILAACDGSAPTPTPPAASAPGQDAASPTVASQAAGGGSPAERGQMVFARYCNVCHPGGQRGSGPSLVGVASNWPDNRLTHTVRNGENRMPPFSTASISDADLTDLIAYVRTIKAQQ